MSRIPSIALLLLAAAIVAPAGAQPLECSGTWKLDTGRSRVVDAAGLSGLIATGAPETLHITRAANGTLVIESRMNESHARIYTPGAKSSTPVGQGGHITTTSEDRESRPRQRRHAGRCVRRRDGRAGKAGAQRQRGCAHDRGNYDCGGWQADQQIGLPENPECRSVRNVADAVQAASA